MPEWTHFDADGAARMVDVSAKAVTQRIARASGTVHMAATTLSAVVNRQLSKGDVLGIARIAGIQAAKRTGELIPLCHPLGLDGVEMHFEPCGDTMIKITAVARVTGRTGVEMEALTAVSVAALTIYDMCKAIDRGMIINAVRLDEKSGGRSGTWNRNDHDHDNDHGNDRENEIPPGKTPATGMI